MGNRLGWILAGAVAVVVLAVVVWVVFFPTPTGPTQATTGPGRLDIQAPGEPVTLVLPAAPSGPGDAGDDYQAAIQARKDNLPALKAVMLHYSDMTKGKYHLTDTDLALVKKLADLIAVAAGKRNMTYYFRLTPQKIEIPYWPTEADEFQDLTDVPLLLSVHYVESGKDSYPQAEKCLFDIFTIGHHLINERARMDLVLRGVGIEKAACDLLTKLYEKWGKPDRIEQVRRYREGLLPMSSIYGDLYKVIWGFEAQEGGALGLHPGNVHNLAANHKDRAVRVEAGLGEGVVKLTCTGRGDRKRVARMIQEKLAGPDPIERAAAKCANELNNEGFQKLLTWRPK